MDFVHDQLALGTKIRVLTIVDTFSRFSPAVEPRFRFRGADVVEILERVGRQHGLPKVIRVDQGTEFVSRDLDLHARRHARLLPSRQADRQRLHRVVQRQAQSGVPIGALVHEPGRCEGEMRGLA